MKVGICGLGNMGQVHLANALKIDGVEVTALCDSDRERLSLASAVKGNIRFERTRDTLDQVPRFSDFARMLGEAELDAVVIAVPTYLHAEFAVAALHAGIHVFSEKPIALTVQDAERMCGAARDRGRILFIGHVVRFFPAYRKIHELIRSQKHGPVLAAEFSRACGLPGWGARATGERSWFTDPARSGGMPVDLHIHDTDFILYSLGAPPAVRAFRAHDGRTGVDVLRTVYLYENALVTSHGAWLQQSAPFSAWARVTFERAAVFFHSDFRGRLQLYPADGERREVELSQVDGYEAELREFFRCIDAGEPSPLAPPESALQTLRVIYQEIESARLGEAVEVTG